MRRDTSPELETEPGKNPWELIPDDATSLRLERDTEFMCSDGVMRQIRIDGEVGFSEVSVYHTFDYKDPYRYTHRRTWVPQLEWAPYYGMRPASHFGYRLETSVDATGQNIFRQLPTDQFIKHESDDWVSFADMSVEDVEAALNTVGIGLDLAPESDPS